MVAHWEFENSKIGFECLDMLKLSEIHLSPGMKIRIIARCASATVLQGYKSDKKTWKTFHHRGKHEACIVGCVENLFRFHRFCCIRIVLAVGISCLVDWGKAPCQPCLFAPSCRFSYPSTSHRDSLSKVYRIYPDNWGCKSTNRLNQPVWLNIGSLYGNISYLFFRLRCG